MSSRNETVFNGLPSGENDYMSALKFISKTGETSVCEFLCRAVVMTTTRIHTCKNVHTHIRFAERHQFNTEGGRESGLMSGLNPSRTHAFSTCETS